MRQLLFQSFFKAKAFFLATRASIIKILTITPLLIIASCSKSDNDVTYIEAERNPGVKNQSPASTKTSQPPASTAPKSLANIASIEDVKLEYAYLMNQKENGKLNTASFEYNCHGEKSGEILFYSEHKQLRFIEHKHNEYSHHSGIDKYFLKNDSPFFVLHESRTWSFEGSKNGEGQTKDRIQEKRFYIVDNQAKKCLMKEYSIFSAREVNPQSEDVPNKEVRCPALNQTMTNLKQLKSLEGSNKDIQCLE